MPTPLGLWSQTLILLEAMSLCKIWSSQAIIGCALQSPIEDTQSLQAYREKSHMMDLLLRKH
jgi:hypothetical protein